MVDDEAGRWGKVIYVWFLPWRRWGANEGLKKGVAWSGMHFKVLTLTKEEKSVEGVKIHLVVSSVKKQLAA